MGADERAAAAAGCCQCLPFRGGGSSLSRGAWVAPAATAATYEIRSSHSRRIQGQCSNNIRRGCSSSSAGGSCSCRPPKLGSTEPQLSCFLLQQHQELLLPEQLPTNLCSTCDAAAVSSCFYCSSRAEATKNASATTAKCMLRVPSCSSHGSSSFHDGDSELAPSTASAAAAPSAAAPSAAAPSAAATSAAPPSAAAPSTAFAAAALSAAALPAATPPAAASAAAPSAAAPSAAPYYSSSPPEYMRRSSSIKRRFPCAACWDCSNNSSISIKVLQLPTANGSTIPALYMHHPLAQQTLLLSHSSNTDLGCTYSLSLLLCRSLTVNVMAYEYTGYGFCCCNGKRTRQQQEQQQQQRRLCRASATGVYSDIRAAFLWLLQQQQQTPQSIILYSEGRGLLPSLRLRGELAAEGLQVGGLVFVSPAGRAAAVAEAEVAGRKKGKGRLSRLLPSCCSKRNDMHEVYMQLLQLQDDELLILEGSLDGSQGCPMEETPPVLLRQRAAAAATIAAPDAGCCTCIDIPKGEGLRRLKEYVQRARQQQQDLVLQQHCELQQQQQQQLCRGLLEKEERALARKQQPKCCRQQHQQPQQQQQQQQRPCACDGEASTECHVQLGYPSPSAVVVSPQQLQQQRQQQQHEQSQQQSP